MKTLLPCLFLLLSNVSNAQLDSCELLFMKFNPQFMSLRTSNLVINELVQNCQAVNRNNVAEDRTVPTDKSELKSLPTPGLGGIQRIHQLGSNVNSAISAQTPDSSLTDSGSFIATDPLQDSLDHMQELELVQNAENPNNQQNRYQRLNQTLQYMAANMRIRWGNSCPKNPFTNKCLRLNSPNIKPAYNRNIDYFAHKENQTELDSILGSRLAKMGKEYKDCVDTGGKEGDCFNKIVLNPISDEEKDTKQEAQLKKDIGSGITDRKAREIVEKELAKDPNLYTKSKASLSKLEKKQADQEFKQALGEVESKKEKEAKEILEAANRTSDKIEKQLDSLKLEQQKTKDLVSALDNNTQNINDLGGNIIPDSLSSNRMKVDDAKEMYSSINDILFSGNNARERLVLKSNCLEGRLPCPPAIARSMGSPGSVERQLFEANSAVQKRFAELNSFSGQVNKIRTGLKQGYDFASSLNLSESDQEKIAIGLHYTEAGLNTVIGFAMAYRGNPQGLIQGIQGLSGLIGGPFKPSPSPELQAIMQLREEMNNRFDRIEEGMEDIMDQQVEIGKNLANNIQTNRELMQFEFSNISYDLADIKGRQNVMLSQLVTLTNTNYNYCKDIYNDIALVPELADLSTYQNFQDIHRDYDIEECLLGLESRLNDSGINSNSPSLSYFTVNLGESNYIDDEFTTFKKLAAFYNWYYGNKLNNLDRAVDLLLMPSDIVSQSFRIYRDFRNEMLVDFGLNKAEVLHSNHYLDPYGFRDFITLYTSFYPYFEIETNSSNSTPRTIDDLINYSSASIPQGGSNPKKNRLIDLESKLISLEKIHSIILAQQSLMSGTNLIRPLYAIIYDNHFAGETITFNSNSFSVKQFAIDILSKNPVLAQNFAIYALRKNFRMNESVYLDSTVWADGMSRNPATQVLLSSGYDDLPLYRYYPQDSIEIQFDSLSSVNINELYEGQYIDSLLHFDRWIIGDTIAMLDIDITGQAECTANANVSCKASIPFPESSTLILDKFSFTAGYEHAIDTQKYLDELKSEILFGRSVPNDWQRTLDLKYTLIKTP